MPWHCRTHDGAARQMPLLCGKRIITRGDSFSGSEGNQGSRAPVWEPRRVSLSDLRRRGEADAAQKRIGGLGHDFSAAVLLGLDGSDAGVSVAREVHLRGGLSLVRYAL
jgi:hypothetical protein